MKPPKSISKAKPSQANLLTVAKFGNGIEAQLARTKLQSQKIESYIFDENMIALMPVYDLALGGVKLKVKDSDLERASKILGQKTRGNFWAPNQVFFITYGFGEFFLWILLIPLGLLVYFMKELFLGSVDQYLLLCFNLILFSVYCFAYSDRLSKSNSTWINKWSESKNGQIELRKAMMALGVVSFALGIALIIGQKHFWYSAALLLWCFISVALWKFFFDFLSSTLLSKFMKKVMPSSRK